MPQVTLHGTKSNKDFTVDAVWDPNAKDSQTGKMGMWKNAKTGKHYPGCYKKKN